MTQHPWSALLKQIKQAHSQDRTLGKLVNELNQYLDRLYENNSPASLTSNHPVSKGSEISTSNPLPPFGVVALYGDGACRGNPGPGAWACFALDHQGQKIFEASSFDVQTTNNKMELSAVIHGLKTLNQLRNAASDAGFRESESEQWKKAKEYEVYSDSKYVIEGCLSWMAQWKRRGWLKSDGKAPENLASWQQLDQCIEGLKAQGIKIKWSWVKGHAGHTHNEYCDQLCNQALDQLEGIGHHN
jgi:ribonuclease HI